MKGIHAPTINSITFSRDGRWLASASSDNSVKLWDVESRNPKPVRTLHRYSYWASGVAFSPDGRQLFSSGSEAMIRVWDVATGAEAAAPLEGHTGWVYALAISPDGLRMASGGGDSTVIVWDVISRKLVTRLFGHIAGVMALAFSPDGRILASGGRDQTIRLWDMKTGQQLSLLRGHGAAVRSLSFSPDGQWLVSRSEDGLVKLWHATLGLEGNALTGSRNALQDVALSPDGRHLASVASDSFAVNLWDLSTRSRTVLTGHTNAVHVCGFFPGRQDSRHRQSRPDGETVGRERSQGRRHAHQRISRGIARLFTGRTNADRRRLQLIISWWVIGAACSSGMCRPNRPPGQFPATRRTLCRLLCLPVDPCWRRVTRTAPSVCGTPKPAGFSIDLKVSSGVAMISLAFSPTEPLLAAGDWGGNIVLYNTTTMEVVPPPLKAHTCEGDVPRLQPGRSHSGLCG